jgi:hypothetical protein
LIAEHEAAQRLEQRNQRLNKARSKPFEYPTQLATLSDERKLKSMLKSKREEAPSFEEPIQQHETTVDSDKPLRLSSANVGWTTMKVPAGGLDLSRYKEWNDTEGLPTLGDTLAINRLGVVSVPAPTIPNAPATRKRIKGMLMSVLAPILRPDPYTIEPALAFLDSGAQHSFISKDFAKKARLKPIRKQKFSAQGFQTEATTFEANFYEISIAMRFRSVDELDVLRFEVAEVQKPLGYLKCLSNKTTVEELQLPALPSSRFYKREPDLLLGIDQYSDIIKERISKLPSGFSMYHTTLGAIVCGSGCVERTSRKTTNIESRSVKMGFDAASGIHPEVTAYRESSASIASPILLTD